MALTFLSCVWLAGIFVGSSLHLPPFLALTGLLPLPLLSIRRRRRLAFLAGLGLALFCFAAAYSYASLHSITDNALRLHNDSGTVEIRGMIATEPQVGDKGIQFTLAAGDLRVSGGWQAVAGNALVFAPRYPAYRYGDVVTVRGKLEAPPQLGDFDYEGYLANRGVYSTISYPAIEVTSRGSGFKPLQWVYTLRESLSQSLAASLPEPQASLAQGIVLGIRSNLPASVKDDFFKTGTTHILAISGMNLGIVAGILLGLGIWLFGRRHFIYIWFAMGAIWLYSLLTGMQPPVVRSAVMASLFLVAELLGRQRSAIVALSFAAAIMVGLNPRLLWDVSFQLSFLAMAGLVFIFPSLRALGRKAVAAGLGEEGGLVFAANAASDAFAVTFSAIIAVWPLVAHYFGIISLVGPVATVLLLPALPGVIITGSLTAITGLLAPPAAQVLAWSAWPFLSYMLLVTGGLARPSLSFLEVGAVSPPVIWGYYSCLAAAVWLFANRRQVSGPAAKAASRIRSGAGASLSLVARVPAKLLIPPLLLAAIVLPAAAVTMPDERLQVSFLDVGEGDAILIQKGHRQVLVDGGPSPQALAVALGSEMPFWDRSIDMLVLTHPHSDHLAGLVDALQRYRVEQVIDPELQYTSSVNDEWTKTIAEKGIKRTIAQDGQRIDLGGGALISVIYPTLPAGADPDIDNKSLVLRVSMGDFSFLLTSDIFQDKELELARQRVGLASTVLKVAHHGSTTSTAPAFLAAVDPQFAVVSVGAADRSGHPDAAVMDRLAARPGAQNVYRTDHNGTVDFITDGKRLWLRTGRQAEK